MAKAIFHLRNDFQISAQRHHSRRTEENTTFIKHPRKTSWKDRILATKNRSRVWGCSTTEKNNILANVHNTQRKRRRSITSSERMFLKISEALKDKPSLFQDDKEDYPPLSNIRFEPERRGHEHLQQCSLTRKVWNHAVFDARSQVFGKSRTSVVYVAPGVYCFSARRRRDGPVRWNLVVNFLFNQEVQTEHLFNAMYQVAIIIQICGRSCQVLPVI